MPTRVQVRAGEVELTIESDSALAVTDIKELLAQVQETAVALQAPYPVAIAHAPRQAASPSPLLLEDSVPQLHINSVAECVGVKTGADLALAAAAYLQLVKGQPTFTRTELLETMKAATSHYTQSHRSNLTAIIKGLIGSKFNQTGNEVYALRNNELADLRGKLAE